MQVSDWLGSRGPLHFVYPQGPLSLGRSGEAHLEQVGSRASHTSNAHTDPLICCRERAPRDFKEDAPVPGRDLVGISTSFTFSLLSPSPALSYSSPPQCGLCKGAPLKKRGLAASAWQSCPLAVAAVTFNAPQPCKDNTLGFQPIAVGLHYRKQGQMVRASMLLGYKQWQEIMRKMVYQCCGRPATGNCL